MSDPKGKLFTFVAFDPDGNPVALRINASGELMAVISGGAGSGTTLVPKGKLFTPIGFDPDGLPVALGADANSQLKIALIGGSANEIIKSDGTDAEWDALADIIKAAILTTVGDIMIVNAGGVVTRLAKPAVGEILGESGQIPAWIAKPTGGYTEGAKATHSVDVTLSNASWTSMPLDTETYDTDGIHDTVTNNSRMTIQTAGKYLLTAGYIFEHHATGSRLMRIKKNATAGICFKSAKPISDGLGQDTFAIDVCIIGDFYEMQAYQNSGGNLKLIATAESPIFTCQRIG